MVDARLLLGFLAPQAKRRRALGGQTSDNLMEGALGKAIHMTCFDSITLAKCKSENCQRSVAGSLSSRAI